MKAVRPDSNADRSCPLTVVMPVYNEEDSIAAATGEVTACVLDTVPGSELWVIDDGSRDGTAQILDRLAAADARVHVVHQVNGGHGAAVLAGLGRARGDWLLLVDSDRQIPLDGFAAAWQRRRGLDALLGRRASREDPLARKVVSAALKLQLRVLFGANLADANAPFKLIRRTLWESARKFIPAGCLIPSVFLALYAHRAGLRYASIDVAYRKRATGRTSLRKLKLLGFSARSSAQLLTFRGVAIARSAAGEQAGITAPAVEKL